MSDFGLLTTGFVPMSLNDIRDDLRASFRALFGTSIDLSDRSIFGQIVGVLSERLALLWELAQAVNASQDPDQATGASLDALCALTGTLRTPAANSTVTLTLCGTPTTVVASGSVASTASTSVRFSTTGSATITLLSSWAISHAYLVDDRVTHASRAYVCTVAGTSAGSGGPTSTSDAITDGGVTWRYLGEGTGAIDVPAISVNLGPIIGGADDITVISTPIGGWASVRNLADAVLGRLDMTDEDLRTLRELELAAIGTSTVDAIRGDILSLTSVESCTVFENVTDTTNGDGMPPHSVEALVRLPVGAAYDQLIWDTLLSSVAAGIATHGTTSIGTSTDSEGTVHTIKYTRPEEITIYIDITLTYDASTYPSDGDAQVKTAIANYGNTLGIGVDAVAARLGARAFTVTGVLDVPRSGSLGGTLIKVTSSPTADTTIAISTRQLAVYAEARITVHSTPATP